MFDITLVGKDGHGSRPDWANNPTVGLLSTIQTALDKIRMRAVNPNDHLFDLQGVNGVPAAQYYWMNFKF